MLLLLGLTLLIQENDVATSEVDGVSSTQARHYMPEYLISLESQNDGTRGERAPRLFQTREGWGRAKKLTATTDNDDTGSHCECGCE